MQVFIRAAGDDRSTIMHTPAAIRSCCPFNYKPMLDVCHWGFLGHKVRNCATQIGFLYVCMYICTWWLTLEHIYMHKAVKELKLFLLSCSYSRSLVMSIYTCTCNCNIYNIVFRYMYCTCICFALSKYMYIYIYVTNEIKW